MQKDFNLEVKIWLAVNGTYQFDLKQRLYEVRLERKGSVMCRDTNHEYSFVTLG